MNKPIDPMTLRKINDLDEEVEIRTTKSGGKGGQHANKTESKVELVFDIEGSALLSKTQKQRLLKRLGSKLTKTGKLILTSEEERSQHANREAVLKRFHKLIQRGLKRPKKRKPTRKPQWVKEKRLEKKKKRSEKKRNRKPPQIDGNSH